MAPLRDPDQGIGEQADEVLRLILEEVSAQRAVSARPHTGGTPMRSLNHFTLSRQSRLARLVSGAQSVLTEDAVLQEYDTVLEKLSQFDKHINHIEGVDIKFNYK